MLLVVAVIAEVTAAGGYCAAYGLLGITTVPQGKSRHAGAPGNAPMQGCLSSSAVQRTVGIAS